MWETNYPYHKINPGQACHVCAVSKYSSCKPHGCLNICDEVTMNVVQCLLQTRSRIDKLLEMENWRLYNKVCTHGMARPCTNRMK